jgi:hypothetical protein
MCLTIFLKYEQGNMAMNHFARGRFFPDEVTVHP